MHCTVTLFLAERLVYMTAWSTQRVFQLSRDKNVFMPQQNNSSIIQHFGLNLVIFESIYIQEKLLLSAVMFHGNVETTSFSESFHGA